MTVALVLTGEAGAGLRGQLAALGVRRVDAADRTGPGLLTVAAAARAAGERVLICGGQDAVPEEILAVLLSAGGTAAFSGVNAGTSRPVRGHRALGAGLGPGEPADAEAPADPQHPGRPDGPGGRAGVADGALVVDPPDLAALASAAESLAATYAGSAGVSALISELTRRGVRVRVLDAGPNSEGAVTQLVIDPAARDVARWAAWRQLAPAALYGISLSLGLVAAVWFSEPATRAKLLAIVALAGSFLAGRAGSLLVATSREGRVRPAVDWLGAASGLLTELAVYAALAVSSAVAGQHGRAVAVGLDGTFGHTLRDTFVAGWGGAGQAGVWRLAIAAMVVLAVRRMAELGFEYTDRTSGHLFSRSVQRTIEQAATLPAGERLVVIAVTAVFFGPRATFLLLLGWGVLAAGYVLAGQLVRSAQPNDDGLAPGGGLISDGRLIPGGGLAAYRGDGVVSRWIGRLVQGRLPPLPPVLVGLFVTCVLTALGLGNLPGILVLTPVEAMLLAALGACHPHDGRLDWLVPALLEVGEYIFLAALGFSHRVPAALVFALLAAVIVRHLDLAYRARFGRGIAADRFGLGWDGRMLLAGLAAVIGITPLVYAVLTGYLWLLFCWDFLSGWLLPTDGDHG
jgi:Family of unknown function (DUF5941)